MVLRRAFMSALIPVLIASTLLLSSCSWVVPEPQDGAPEKRLDPASIPDAVPRRDVIVAAGNKSPYQVLGKTYEVMTEYRGYRDRGIASWYGTKFHGRLTSNGETYDLYAMTAAHRTLPIPVYVQVTNLENGRRAIVRVNDRGPFHSERLIDLSYAAAVKLGFAEKGTAPVEIAVIDQDNRRRREDPASPRYFLQVGAFQVEDSARRLQAELAGRFELPVHVTLSDGSPALHRVRVGPFTDYLEAERVRRSLHRNDYGLASIVSDDG